MAYLLLEISICLGQIDFFAPDFAIQHLVALALKLEAAGGVRDSLASVAP